MYSLANGSRSERPLRFSILEKADNPNEYAAAYYLFRHLVWLKRKFVLLQRRYRERLESHQTLRLRIAVVHLGPESLPRPR